MSFFLLHLGLRDHPFMSFFPLPSISICLEGQSCIPFSSCLLAVWIMTTSTYSFLLVSVPTSLLCTFLPNPKSI